MLTNGCFGSPVAASFASPACQSCAERDKCFEAVEASRDEVIALIPRRMKVRGAEDEAEAVVAKATKYLRKALVPPVEKTKGVNRVEALRVKLESQGIQIEDLRKRRNPFSEVHDGPYFHMAAFICEGYPFTPKDLTEAVCERGTALKQSSVTSEVSRFVALLVETGILKKEKRILCLA